MTNIICEHCGQPIDEKTLWELNYKKYIKKLDSITLFSEMLIHHRICVINNNFENDNNREAWCYKLCRDELGKRLKEYDELVKFCLSLDEKYKETNK